METLAALALHVATLEAALDGIPLLVAKVHGAAHRVAAADGERMDDRTRKHFLIFWESSFYI